MREINALLSIAYISALALLQCSCAQDASAPAPAPTPQALPLPESPETMCTGKTFHEATSEAPVCSETMYSYKDPELPCCEALAKFYGVNSTKPSRNCFCYEPYWTRLQVLEEVTYIQLMSYLDFCSTSNLTIAYYQDGEGPCAGLPAASAEGSGSGSGSTSSEPVAGRTLHQWIRDLKGEGLMTFSFTLGLISAIGFVAMLWPLFMDSAFQLYKMGSKKNV